MLARAARRTAHRVTAHARINAIGGQLYLPWLCPAYNASRRQLRHTGVDGPADGLPLGSRRRRNSNDGDTPSARASTSTPSRAYATTATGAYDIPLVGFHDPFPVTGNNPPRPISTLNPINFDQTPPLMITGTTLIGPPMRRRFTTDGTGGDFSEHLSIFKACLQIGKMERAGVVLKRIAAFDEATPEVLLELHNEYLKAAIDQMLWRPSGTANLALHKWFELEIRNTGLPIDANTLGYILRASLQSLDEDRKHRLVRRYMDVCKLNELLPAVLSLDVLTAEELHQITHICPEYNGVQLDELEEEEPVKDTVVDIPAPQVMKEEILPAEVRPVPQKGLGLKSLRESLSLLNENDASGLRMESLTMDERRAMQTRLETNSVTSAIQRWREENAHLKKMGLDTTLQTKSLGARMWKWSNDLTKALEEELIKCDESERKDFKLIADRERCQYGPFLRLLPAEKLAAITIIGVMSRLASLGVEKGVTLSQCVVHLAENVEDEALFDVAQQENKKLTWSASMKKNGKDKIVSTQVKKAKRFSVTLSPSRDSESSPGQLSARQVAVRQALSDASWPTPIKAKIGACLLGHLVETAKVPVSLEDMETKEILTQMQPAFSHSYRVKNGRQFGTVIANKVLVAQLQREPVHSLLAKHLPMLVKPDKWTEFGKGGFLSHPVKVMRVKHGDVNQRHYAEAAIETGDMEQTFKGLDVLGKTPWKINQPVFNVMLEAWNSGQAVANIAPANPKLERPPEPASDVDPFERRMWIRAVKMVENTRKGFHSKRCFQNFQLEIARSLRNETFYFPHNVDFRGRAYPIPPYLNHIGADHCRGLLKFGIGKPLGEAGLRWLKIHLANVFGFDKASLSEREAFASEHITNIFDSATNPLHGSRWWLEAEDPWQTLATCIELKNALESPDPTKFISDLPVHQDGTCNGLQHYAALGGDFWGATQVNLEPGGKPGDVYTAVAELVKAGIKKDQENGHEWAQILDGKVTRKIVKQTVMTNVYGVTFNGAKAQVRKALVEQYGDLPQELKCNPGLLAGYIAKKIFESLGSMFQGAHDIQYWLGECAGRISHAITPEQMNRWELNEISSLSVAKKSKKSRDNQVSLADGSQFRSTVIWTTPLRMPVVQPYRQDTAKDIITNMQKIKLSEPHQSQPVSKRKQIQGFPPNFIHSLDATHMLLSALQCDQQGLTFAAVHDSFWTHAADTDVMNNVLREAFIRIHSDDVIGRLAAEFKTRYKGCITMVSIRPGTAVHKKILLLRKEQKVASRSAANGVRMQELLAEYRRQRLLASSDPAEVEEGKRMVTAASIIEESSGEDDIVPEPELKDIGLGDMTATRSPANSNLSTDDEADDEADEEHDDGCEGLDGSRHGDADDSPHITRGFNPKDKRTDFQKRMALKPRVSKKAATWAWVPLTFPPVPVRGNYDLSRVRDSRYFFS